MLSQRADEGKAFAVKLKRAFPIGNNLRRQPQIWPSSPNPEQQARERRGPLNPTRSKATAKPRWLTGIHSLASPISVQIHMLRTLEDERAELTERLSAVSSDVVDSLGQRDNRGGRPSSLHAFRS